MENDATKYESLKQIAELRGGYSLRGSADALPAGDAAFIQMRDVDDGLAIDWSGIARVELPSERKATWLEDGDILFAARGQNNYALTLMSLSERCVCAPQFFHIRVKDKAHLDPEFLAWQLNQSPAQNYLAVNRQGSAQPVIRRTTLESLEITIPSLYKQKEVAQFWSAAREERTLLTALIHNRQRAMDAIARDLLTHRMTGDAR